MREIDRDILRTKDKRIERHERLTFEIKRENNNAKASVVIQALGSYSKNVKNWIEVKNN